MPWSYRRSRKVGPFRINFSKGGIGYSMGNKYLRYGKTAKGRSYISSAPVTGLRYQQTLSTTGGGRGKSRGSSTSPLVSHPAYNPAAAEIMTAESDRLIAQSEWIASESERIQRMLANPNLTDRERSVLDSALEASTERSKQITEQLREQTERLNAQSAQLRAQSMVPTPVYSAPPPQQQSQGRGRGCLIPVGIIIGLLILLTSLNSTTGGKATTTPLATAVRTIATATSAPVLQATAASSLSVATLAPSATPSPTTPAPTTIPQIVTVKEEAVNLRQSADVDSAVVTLVPPGTDAQVIGEDSTGPDGVTRYVHARVGDQEGYLRSDLVSAPHVATPAPPTAVPTATEVAPTATSPSSLAALQAWSSTYGYIIGAIGSDDDAVAQAASAQSFPALLTTCRQLASDTATAQSFPPIPDADTATHLRLAYGYQAQSARDCITGVNNVDPTSLRKSGAEAQLAASELNLATASLKRAAGLP